MKQKLAPNQVIQRAVGQAYSHTTRLEATRAEGDGNERTLPIAITSDAPIEHWFGYLILNHAPECVRMERLTAGAPLLLEHDRTEKIGGLFNARTDGHVLRADAKFSRRKKAQAELEDIEDGIGRGISGGFRLFHLVLVEQREDDWDVYRSDDWMPYEASLVSIPADISVGVGRALELPAAEAPPVPAADTQTDTSRAVEREAETEPPIPAIVTERAEAAAMPGEQPLTTITTRSTMDELERELLAIGERFGETELARDFALAGRSPQELRDAILNKRTTRQAPVPTPPVQLSEREMRAYNIGRAIQLHARGRETSRAENCFEFEVSDQIARALGTPAHGGFFMPTNLQRRVDLETRAGLEVKTPAAGGNAVFTEYAGFLELLRNRAMVAQMGATFLTGLQGNLQFVRQATPGIAYWMGENPVAGVAQADLTLDIFTLSPKILMAKTSYSRQLLAQSVLNVDTLVLNDLAAVNALELDRTCLHGTGIAPEPRGIYQQSGVNAIAFGGAISYDKVVDMETAIVASNADIGTMGYLTTPNIRGKAKKTPQLANTIALPIWQGNELNGYNAQVSNNLSKTMLGSAATGGTEHGMIFGVWSNLLIGEWGAMEIVTDPYSKKDYGMIEVVTYLMADHAVKYGQAFSKSTGLTVN